MFFCLFVFTQLNLVCSSQLLLLEGQERSPKDCRCISGEQDRVFSFQKSNRGTVVFVPQMLQIEQKLIHFSLRVPDSSQAAWGGCRWGWGAARGETKASAEQRCHSGLRWQVFCEVCPGADREPLGRVPPLCPGKSPDHDGCCVTPFNWLLARPTDSLKRGQRGECGTQPSLDRNECNCSFM